MTIYTVQKKKFSIKDFFSKCDQIPQLPADLVTFTEKIFNRKLNFCAVLASLVSLAKSLNCRLRTKCL